jgi:hypothetical protein
MMPVVDTVRVFPVWVAVMQESWNPLDELDANPAPVTSTTIATRAIKKISELFDFDRTLLAPESACCPVWLIWCLGAPVSGRLSVLNAGSAGFERVDSGIFEIDLNIQGGFDPTTCGSSP